MAGDREGDKRAGDKRLASGKSALKNRLAQQCALFLRRYREKVKQRQKNAAEELAILQQRLNELQVETEALDERNRLLEAGISSSSPCAPGNQQEVQEAAPATRQPWQSPQTPAALARMLNAIRHGGPLVTVAEAAQMQPLALQKFKQEFVSRLAIMLVKGAQPGTTAGDELEAFVITQRSNLHDVIASLTAGGIRTLLAAGENQHKIKALKRALLEALALTPEQKDALLALRGRAKSELDAVAALRAEAAEILAKAQKPDEQMVSKSSHAAYLSRVRAAELLKESLEAERRSFVALKLACQEVITPHQEARALVAASPDSWLDFMVLTEYLAAEAEGRGEQWLADGGCTGMPPSKVACSGGLQLESSASLQAAGHTEDSPDAGQLTATPFLEDAPASSCAGSDGLPVLLENPTERSPSIPVELMQGLEGADIEEWLALLSSV